MKIDKLIRSRRRTLALEITHEASLIVRAPLKLPLAMIEEFVAKKQKWILKKQAALNNRQSFIPMGKEEAHRRIFERVGWHSQVLGLKFSRLSLSSARTRWGSCTTKGSIRINWRLAMAPLEILDYVIIHELMHLAVRNHSNVFWAKVGAVMADYRSRRRWLRENGHRLYAGS